MKENGVGLASPSLTSSVEKSMVSFLTRGGVPKD